MLNQIILVGRLTADPVFHEGKEEGWYTFSLAINNNPKDETCEFVDCSCGKHLNNAVDHLNKGDKVAITGKFSNRKFQRKDGSNGVSATIYVNELEFVDVKTEEAEEVEEIKPQAKTTTRRK